MVIVDKDGKQVWETETEGKPGPDTRLVLEDNGELVLLSNDHEKLWSHIAGKVLQRAQNLLPANEALRIGECLEQGQHKLVFQDDGNLVLFSADTIMWSSKTTTTQPGLVVVQECGKVVMLDSAGHEMWSVGTADGHGSGPSTCLLLNEIGNLVLIANDGSTIWSSVDKHGEASDTAGSSPLSETCPVNQLSVFQELLPNDCIRSLSDLHELVYQEDGDLVLYANGIRRWASNTAGLAPGSVFVSEDGNLIMHDSTEQVVWSTGTKAEAGSNAHILLQEDGNVVLCAHDGTNLWSTGTVCDLSGGTQLLFDGLLVENGQTLEGFDKHSSTSMLFVGKELRAGQKLTSKNGTFELVYEAEGNLVLYAQGEVDWSTGTGGMDPGRVVVENHGELIIYNNNGELVWSTETLGKVGPNNRIVLQDDGNLVLISEEDVVLWAKDTSSPFFQLDFSRHSELIGNTNGYTTEELVMFKHGTSARNGAKVSEDPFCVCLGKRTCAAEPNFPRKTDNFESAGAFETLPNSQLQKMPAAEARGCAECTIM